MRLRRTGIALVLAAGFAVLSGGCGGASDGDGASPGSRSGLAGALAAVGDDPLSRQYMEYGDTPALRRLAGAPAAVEGVLLRIGAQRRRTRGLEFLALGREGRVDPGELPVPLGLPSSFDRVVARPETVAAGSSERAVAVALGAGAGRLDRVPAFAAAARCLGDVVAARLSSGKFSGARPEIELVAAGVLRPTGDGPLREALCLIARDAATADRNLGALRPALGKNGRDPITGGRRGEQLAAVSVGRADSAGQPVVRAVLTLRPQVSAGYLFRAAQAFALPPLGTSDRRPLTVR